MFETIWHEIHSLVYPCSPIKILLNEIEMLGASVDILDQLLELSVTGDTAKYLVLTLQRLCTFTIRPNKPKLSSSTQFVLRKRRELRRDFSEAYSPSHTGLTRSTYILYICLSSQEESMQLNPSSQSPYD